MDSDGTPKGSRKSAILVDAGEEIIPGGESGPPAGSRLSVFNPLSEIRKMVSKDRVRYKDGTYDLDLTYITPEIIGK